jgi:HlyD family secretion protein
MNKFSLTSAPLLAAAFLSAGCAGAPPDAARPDAPAFRTAKVVRGPLAAVVRATGTVEPEEVIDVGAQVNGLIMDFGADPRDADKGKADQRRVDFGTPVEEGTVLASIDDTLYASDVAVAKKNLAVDEAAVKQAEGNVDAARSKLAQTQREWERVKRLGGPGGAVSQTDYDAALNAYETAKAAAPTAEAALVMARAVLDRDQASLDKAEKALGYCTIKSPVKGVIIDRRVNVGQTVVSSLNAPSLFLIAKDLTHLQVWASVNEADIGAVRVGQEATFTVDARPGKTFKGVVRQVRLNATTTQNVVAYTVVVAVENEKPPKKDGAAGDELALLPYLTADVQFAADRRENLLLVPNAALRWKPQPAQVAPDYRDEYERALRRDADPKRAEEEKPPRGRAVVWVEDKGFARPVKVVAGGTDGAATEVVKVLDGELPEGAAVITGAAAPGGR